MLIIIEGRRGTGKTSLANLLKSHYGQQAIQLKDPRPDTTPLECLVEVVNKANAHAYTDKIMINDRFHLTEMVNRSYETFTNAEGAFTQSQMAAASRYYTSVVISTLNTLKLTHRAVMIGLRTDDGLRRQRLAQRSADHRRKDTNGQAIKQLWFDYGSHLNWFVNDTPAQLNYISRVMIDLIDENLKEAWRK